MRKAVIFDLDGVITVARGTKHRIAAPTDKEVEIIETQIGEDFPEEDIIRYQNDYGR